MGKIETRLADGTLTAAAMHEDAREDDWSMDDEDDVELFDDAFYDAPLGSDLTKRYQRLQLGQPSANPSHVQGQESNSIPKPTAASMEAALTRKFAHRLHMDDFSSFSASAKTSMKSATTATANDGRSKDKADRATTEQVLDPRTRMILFKLLNQNSIYEINGCISTGKEANVYHAATDSGQHRAIKIYKTSILVFKDRDRYVTGEFRFRHGYSKHNPRKMVKVWAEKEMRNLKRLWMAKIACPEPLLLRSHVLMMTFVGTSDGRAAPRLKDTPIESVDKWSLMYRQVVKMVRIMYHVCRLVHADLSEYNMLYHRGQVYIIDVSQSVEHDHPNALEFLRKDCANVTDFFQKKQVETLSLRRLFEFVIGNIESIPLPSLTMLGDEERVGEAERMLTAADDLMDTWLNEELEQQRSEPRATAEIQVENEVFRYSYIPRSMAEIGSAEADAGQVQSEEKVDQEDAMTAMMRKVLGVSQVAAASYSSDDEEEDSLSSSSGSESSSESDADHDDGDINSEESEFSDDSRRAKTGIKHQSKADRKVRVLCFIWSSDYG